MRTLNTERRNAIVDTATELFQEMGYERTSMNEVARRVGGSKATLYNYFSSKEALFEMVVRTYSTQLLNAAALELATYSQGDMPFEQKLQRFGERMLGVLVTDHRAIKIYRCVLAEAGNSCIGELYRAAGTQESLEKLAELMATAIKAGELKHADPMLRAIQFTSLMKAEAYVMLLQREPVPRTAEQVKEMVSRGVQLFLYGALALAESNNE
ncbi:TetR/AcrR family transcriptional regulator [Rouxiella sp. T17]|uniref:TetR/AcrR family transcriptional regulator n=1 Tax=Rouxiella sp. T17 TaxID=3085684 RepID=UPI002FCA499B